MDIKDALDTHKVGFMSVCIPRENFIITRLAETENLISYRKYVQSTGERRLQRI